MPDSADVSHHPFQAEMDELVACVLEGRETSIERVRRAENDGSVPGGGSVGGARRPAGCAAVDRRLERNWRLPNSTETSDVMSLDRSRRDFLKAVARRDGDRADHRCCAQQTPRAAVADAVAERSDPGRAVRRGDSRPAGSPLGAAHAGRRAGGGRRRLRRPADARERAVGQPGLHDARLPRGAGPPRRRRGHHRDAGSLAHADGGRRDERRQGRLRREADGAGARRRAAHHRGRAADRPHPAGRQPARQLDRLREGAGSCSAPARSAS